MRFLASKIFNISWNQKPSVPYAKTTFRTGFTLVPALVFEPIFLVCACVISQRRRSSQTETRPWWLKPSVGGRSRGVVLFGIMKGSSFWLWWVGGLTDGFSCKFYPYPLPLFPRYTLSSITKRNLYWIVLWQAINIQTFTTCNLRRGLRYCMCQCLV